MNDLLLLHGALGTSAMFDALCDSLGSRFSLHRLTFSGHGEKSDYQGPLNIELFASEVIRYLDERNLKNVHVFGYSMGGYVALLLAAHHSSRIKNVFTLATVFDWSPERADKEKAMLNPEKIELKLPAFADSLKKLHGDPQWKILMNKTSDLMCELGNKHLSAADFASITCPVRIGVGDRDKMVSIDFSLTVSRQIPQGSFLVLPETAHPFEQVDIKRLQYEIQSFLNQK